MNLTPEQFAELCKHLAWPLVVVFGCIFFSKKVHRILEAIIVRIEHGAEITTPWMTLSAPSQLTSPEENEQVTEKHLALIHSSWRYPKKDREFNKKMYAFGAIIQANTDVLDKIESVTYLLPGWPRPYDKQEKNERSDNFKMKDLAWGEFTLQAEVKVKGQDEVIRLNRYINLSERGPKM